MRIIFYVLLFSQSISYSQNKVETLINQLASDIFPKNFNFYYLVEESLNEKKAFDSLYIEFPNDFILRYYADLPKDLLHKVENKTVNWKKYTLNNSKYITQEMAGKFTCNSYDVYFVDNKISIDSLENLNKNKGIKTLIVPKSKKWSEKRVWEEITKTWNEHKDNEKEQKKCYKFSNPIFSKDEKYARISVEEYKIGEGNCITYIYKYENDNWNSIARFYVSGTKVTRTHVSCHELSVILMN